MFLIFALTFFFIKKLVIHPIQSVGTKNTGKFIIYNLKSLLKLKKYIYVHYAMLIMNSRNTLLYCASL